MYVELLRAWRALRVYGAVVAALVLVSLFFSRGHVVIVGDDASHGPSFALLAIAAAYIAVPIVIALGTTLYRGRCTAAITWTRPVSRTRIALTYVAVNVAAIVCAFAIAMLALVVVLVSQGLFGIVHGSAATVTSALTGLGMLFMWYALLQAVSVALDRDSTVRGLSAPIFLVLAGLLTARVSPPLHGLIMVLNVLNPIAWYSETSGSSVGVFVGAGASATARSGYERVFHVVPQPLATFAPWIIGVLAVAVAVSLWSRREAA